MKKLALLIVSFVFVFSLSAVFATEEENTLEKIGKVVIKNTTSERLKEELQCLKLMTLAQIFLFSLLNYRFSSHVWT